MTTSRPRLRRLARSFALALFAVPLLGAPAYAKPPQGWSDPEPVNGLHALLVLGGIPLALFVVISVLAMAPSWVRGERAAHATGESEWFGGPRTGIAELEAPSDQTDEHRTGGASGGW